MNLTYRQFKKHIAGTVDGKPFNVSNSEDNLQVLKSFKDSDNPASDVMEWVKNSHNQEIAGSNEYLMFNPVKHQYFLVYDGYRSKEPIPQVLVDFIEDSYSKDIDFLPIIKAWARLLGNPRCDHIMADYFAKYLKATYLDTKEANRLVKEEDYTEDVAEAMSTYQDIAITQEGLLATYKVAEMVTWEYVMIFNDETQEYEKKRNPKYKPIPAELDPTTGAVLKAASFTKPDFLEDYLFTPAICKHGDQFFSGKDLGYVYKVGEIQRLPKKALRNLRNTFGGGGLYIGGLNYIESYNNSRTHVLTCFVNPSDILSFQDSGQAIRVDALMPNNVWDEEVPLKGVYHSSDYDKMSTERLDELVKEAVAGGVKIKEQQVKYNEEHFADKDMSDEKQLTLAELRSGSAMTDQEIADAYPEEAMDKENPGLTYDPES